MTVFLFFFCLCSDNLYLVGVIFDAIFFFSFISSAVVFVLGILRFIKSGAKQEQDRWGKDRWIHRGESLGFS